MQEAKKVRDKYKYHLLKIEGVSGIGIGKRKHPEKGTIRTVIIVYINKKVIRDLNEIETKIPHHLEGIPVIIEEMEPPSAF